MGDGRMGDGRWEMGMGTDALCRAPGDKHPCSCPPQVSIASTRRGKRRRRERGETEERDRGERREKERVRQREGKGEGEGATVAIISEVTCSVEEGAVCNSLVPPCAPSTPYVSP
eukprot:3940094-Rhodomonas_salina.2